MEWLLTRLPEMIDSGEVLVFANQIVRVEEVTEKIKALGHRYVACFQVHQCTQLNFLGNWILVFMLGWGQEGWAEVKMFLIAWELVIIDASSEREDSISAYVCLIPGLAENHMLLLNNLWSLPPDHTLTCAFMQSHCNTWRHESTLPHPGPEGLQCWAATHPGGHGCGSAGLGHQVSIVIF